MSPSRNFLYAWHVAHCWLMGGPSTRRMKPLMRCAVIIGWGAQPITVVGTLSHSHTRVAQAFFATLSSKSLWEATNTGVVDWLADLGRHDDCPAVGILLLSLTLVCGVLQVWVEWTSQHTEIPVYCLTLYLAITFNGPQMLEESAAYPIRSQFALWNLLLAVFR